MHRRVSRGKQDHARAAFVDQVDFEATNGRDAFSSCAHAHANGYIYTRVLAPAQPQGDIMRLILTLGILIVLTSTASAFEGRREPFTPIPKGALGRNIDIVKSYEGKGAHAKTIYCSGHCGGDG